MASDRRAAFRRETSAQEKIDRYRRQIGQLAAALRLEYVRVRRVDKDDPVTFVALVRADGRGTIDSVKGDATEHLASFTDNPEGYVGAGNRPGGDLILWGSDCLACEGNTTPDSMCCDNCGSDKDTVPLYVGPRHLPTEGTPE